MSSEKGYVTFVIRGIALDGTKKTPILLLQDKGERLLLPIWIGTMEAGAIYTAMEGHETSRPMTHDLLYSICELSDYRILGVDICDLEDQTFYASLRLETPDGSILKVDCRPSDGVAMSVRSGGDIRVAHSVLDAAQPIEKNADESEAGIQFVSCDDEAGRLRLEAALVEMTPEDFGEFET